MPRNLHSAAARRRQLPTQSPWSLLGIGHDRVGRQHGLRAPARPGRRGPGWGASRGDGPAAVPAAGAGRAVDCGGAGRVPGRAPLVLACWLAPSPCVFCVFVLHLSLFCFVFCSVLFCIYLSCSALGLCRLTPWDADLPPPSLFGLGGGTATVC